MKDLPTPAEVQQALLRPQYDAAPWGVSADMDSSFRSFLDGNVGATGTVCDGGAISIEGINGSLLHGAVHMWVGGADDDGNPGSLSDTVISPNDPIFWLHHANIDRIAEGWWALNDYEFLPVSGGPRGSNLNDRLWPYDVTSADMAVRIESLGYSYDVSVTLDPAATFIGAADWVAQRGSGEHQH